MAMTRKHYQQFADMINSAREDITDEAASSDLIDMGFRIGQHFTLGWIASTLAYICEDDNPRFDRDKFMKACGIPDQ